MTPGPVYVTRKFTFSAAHRYWPVSYTHLRAHETDS